MNNTIQLTFARFLAAISIVIYHFGDKTVPFDIGKLHLIAKAGSLGVSFFFVLSGFVMILAYNSLDKSCNWKSYMINRAARILPLYYFAFLLMAIYLFLRLIVLNQSFTYDPRFSDIILNLTLLQSWVPTKAQTFNTAAWSLSVEFVFYFLFPFVLNRIIRKTSFITYSVFVFSFFALSQYIIHGIQHSSVSDINYWFLAPWLHINTFLVGTWFGLLFFRFQGAGREYLFVLLSLLCCYILAILFKPNYLIYHCGLLAFLFGTIILFLAIDTGITSKFFKTRFLEFLGEISYGIYILQFPIYFFFTGILSFMGVKMVPLFLYIYLVLLIFISGLSYKFIEHPLRERIKSINYKK